MAAITLDQMKDKLVPLSEVIRQFGQTEPLTSHEINSATPVRFRLFPGWETELEATSDHSLVDAFVTIGGRERQLTKEAALQATSEIGVPTALVRRTPGNLIEPLLNHFFSDLPKPLKALSVGGESVNAFTKETIVPFSNLALLEQITEQVHERVGDDALIYADYKLNHSLQDTNLRLVLPGLDWTMEGTGMGDVPVGGDDVWFSGLHLRNSLIGKGQTSIEPYQFRWWCTNGCTTERKAGAAWSRQGLEGQNLDEVYSWARRAVDEALDGMDAEFESIQSLTQLSVAGNLAEVLAEIFGRYDLPVSQREAIRTNLENHDGPLTMYAIMQAITLVANDSTLAPTRADRLMRIGGAITSTEFDPLKARVWREGHTADAQRSNPYEIRRLS